MKGKLQTDFNLIRIIMNIEKLEKEFDALLDAFESNSLPTEDVVHSEEGEALMRSLLKRITGDSTEAAFRRKTLEMISVFKKKNADYGNSYAHCVDTWGAAGIMIPIENKVSRLSSLLRTNENKVGESTIDSMRDLANYAVLGWISLEKK